MLGFEPRYTTAEAFADFGALRSGSRRAATARSCSEGRGPCLTPESPWLTPSHPDRHPRSSRPWHGQRAPVLGRPQPGRHRRRRPARKAGAEPCAKPAAREARRRPVEPSQPQPPDRPRAVPPSRPTSATRSPASRSATGSSAFQGAAVEVFGDQWERRLAEFLAFLRRRLVGRLRRRRVRLRPRDHRAVLHGRAAPDRARSGSASRCAASRTSPTDGWRARRLQPLRHGAGRRPDDDARRSTTTPAGTCARSAPTWSSSCRWSARWPARAARRWPATRTPSGCCAAASSSASGPRASRASASRSASATSCSGSAAAASSRPRCAPACRSSRCSVVGAEEIYPLVGNLPVAGPAARRALHPDHAVLPAARPARPGAAAVQVAARVRRADPHRRPTTPARPTTRCWSSTSPTRCARRSSRRSTRC